MYHVFVRNWWKQAGPGSPFYPGLEPDPSARKTTLARNVKTEDEARAICAAYLANHKPGRLSRKAEYEEQQP